MIRTTKNTTKAVTVRLSQADYIDLLHSSERSNSSIADTLRKAWRQFRRFSSELSPQVKIYAAFSSFLSARWFSGLRCTSVIKSQFLMSPLQRRGLADFAFR